MFFNFPAVTECTTNVLCTFKIFRMKITQIIKNSSDKRKQKGLVRKISVIEG